MGCGWGKMSKAVVFGLIDHFSFKFPGASAEPEGMNEDKEDRGRKTHQGHSGALSWIESAPQLCTGLGGMPWLQDQLTDLPWPCWSEERVQDRAAASSSSTG